jgi:hypothetical protein
VIEFSAPYGALPQHRETLISKGSARMTENRYAPPAARVEDVQLPSGDALIEKERPPQILFAIKLAAAGYVMGLIVMIICWEYYAVLQSVSATILTQVISLALGVWFYSKIHQGRNWARITLLVFSMIGLLMYSTQGVATLLKAAPALVKAQMAIGLVINFWTLWLLFLSPGREWFRKPKRTAPR